MKRLIAILLLSTSAHATLTPSVQRGEKLVDIQVDGHVPEVCVIPSHMGGANYSKKDLKTEGDLCALQEGVNAAACAKTESTNPGLNIFAVPDGMTATQVVAKDCNVDGISKVAKYKMSSSCSYAPSLLGYYHVSRILGGVGMVPVAVLRSYDLKSQIQVEKRGYDVTSALVHGQPTLIHQNIGTLLSRLQAGAGYKLKDQLFTDDFSQSYGALQDNPKHEDTYVPEFFNGGTDRNATFAVKNAILLKQATDKDISQVVGREFNKANLQLMVQLKDVTDMIVIDTVMNQQDRFGNIHFLNRTYYYDPASPHADGSADLQSDKFIDPVDAKAEDKAKIDKLSALGAITVKRMLLKDNDCGVAKEGRIKAAGLPAKIRHLDPETYQRLLAFDAIADQPDTRKFFTSGLMFSGSDYDSIRKNLKELSADLLKRCRAGQIKLDLDLDRHFSGLPLAQVSCEPQG